MRDACGSSSPKESISAASCLSRTWSSTFVFLAIDQVMNVIAGARNEWAKSTAALVLEQALPADDDEPELPIGEEGDDAAP